MEKQKIGKLGENIAKKYFEKRGNKILARNLTFQKLEIDLVVRTSSGKIIIVEVKTLYKQNRSFRPEDQWNKKKQQNTRRAAQAFLGRYPQYINEEGIQIDLIAIELQSLRQGDPYTLRHYENL